MLAHYHACEQLLPAGEDGRGRPGVRYQAGRQEAPPLRGGQRSRHPPEGGDHGRPFPRAGGRTAEDRRRGAGHGRHEQHPEGHQLLLRHSGLPGGAQEPVPGHRRLLRRARVRRHEESPKASLNGFSSNLIADRIQEDPYRFLVCADKIPDRLRRAVAAHDVRRQGAVGREGGSDVVASQPGPSQET